MLGHASFPLRKEAASYRVLGRTSSDTVCLSWMLEVMEAKEGQLRAMMQQSVALSREVKKGARAGVGW